MNDRFTKALFLGAAFLLQSVTGFAVDKSGVSPESISVPSGPGSIEGLGSSFQPLMNTGNATYDFELDLPEGINQHTPKVSLSYNSGLGEGPMGIGWSFDVGSISRQIDRGMPQYVDGANSIDDDVDGIIDELDELDRFVGPTAIQH